MYTPDLPPHSHTDGRKPGLLQLLPFFVFVASFMILHFLYLGSDTSLKTGFSLTAVVLALFVSLFTFTEKHSLNEKINVFINGTRRTTIIYMCYIFIFSSIFTHIVGRIGGIDAAINLGLNFIRPNYILPGLFTLIALFAFTIGSSLGSIVSFMPIALGFGQKLSVNPSLIAGVVVGASMLGDNLSMISDTTIASCKISKSTIPDKIKDNLRIVGPSFFITFLLLVFINRFAITTTFLSIPATTFSEAIKIFPYGVVFALAISGLDVLAVLVAGALVAMGIGVYHQSFTFLETTSFVFNGFYSQPGMVGVMMLIMFIAGLAKIVEYNGGIDYVLESMEHLVTSKRKAESMIALLASGITAAIVSNTVGILVSGEVAKKIGDSFEVRPPRIANLLDMFACISYGVLPYAPPLLLAGALAGVSSISIIPYLHYQFVVTIVAIITILRVR